MLLQCRLLQCLLLSRPLQEPPLLYAPHKCLHQQVQLQGLQLCKMLQGHSQLPTLQQTAAGLRQLQGAGPTAQSINMYHHCNLNGPDQLPKVVLNILHPGR